MANEFLLEQRGRIAYKCFEALIENVNRKQAKLE